MINPGGFAATLLLGAFLSLPARAASWGADAGDAQTRSDIEMLAAAGAVDSITGQWPLAWGSIQNRLENSSFAYPGYLVDAAVRVLARAKADTSDIALRPGMDLDFASAPATVRGFDALGRQAVQGQAIMDYAEDGTAIHLALGGRTTNRHDRQELMLDGLYIAQAFGGAVVYAGYVPRWWGPGWETALSLSNNARPFPSIGITRAGTDAFATPWLSWLGPWQVEFFVGVLDGKRLAMNTLFNGLRFSINPLPGLELALSRTEQSCGTGHPCQPVAEFFNANNDPAHPSKSKDETNFDLRYTNELDGIPFAFYAQVMDRDTGPFTNSDSSHLFGATLWLPLADTPLRLTAEYASTISTLDFFSFGNYLYGITYTDYKYTDGWQYRGFTMGSSLDADSRLFSLAAAVLIDGISTSLTYHHADIGSPLSVGSNIVSTMPVTLNVGELRVGFPFQNFQIDLAGRFQDDQPRPDHGSLLSVETRLRMSF